MASPSQHTSIWSDPSRFSQVMPPVAPPARASPPPLSSPVAPAPAPTGGDVFDDAVLELKQKMEQERAELQQLRESAVAAPPPAPSSAAPAESGAPPAAAAPRRGSGGVDAAKVAAASADELLRMQSDKERVERQEREVRSRLDERLRLMHEEAMRLNAMRQELAAMTEPARMDIQVIRDKIERCERDLSYARRKHALKKQEFEAAEKEMNDHARQKELLVGHLNTIIMDMTRKKEARLQQLEVKLREMTEAKEPAFAGFPASS